MDEILKLFGGAENLWAMIQANAPKVGLEATKTMLELFYVLKSPDTNLLKKSLIVAALGYQLLPEDAMSIDKYGWLGFLDNGVTLAFAYSQVKSSITPEIEQHVNAILGNWFKLNTQSSQRIWAPEDKSQNGNFAPPIYKNPQQTNNPPSMDDHFDNNNNPSSQKPIWDNDEDVVID